MYKEAINAETERVLEKIGQALGRSMKIDAVSSRGSKKDFVDIYFLLEEYSLPQLLEIFYKKYSGIDFNKLHIFKSLVYFINAEEEPMPTMLKYVGWKEIKKKIEKEISNILK